MLTKHRIIAYFIMELNCWLPLAMRLVVMPVGPFVELVLLLVVVVDDDDVVAGVRLSPYKKMASSFMHKKQTRPSISVANSRFPPNLSWHFRARIIKRLVSNKKKIKKQKSRFCLISTYFFYCVGQTIEQLFFIGRRHFKIKISIKKKI